MSIEQLALPWTGAGSDILDDNGFSFCLIAGEKERRDVRREFIVRACNSHEDLLAACEAHAAWTWAEKFYIGSFRNRVELCNYSEYMTARALVKVSGGDTSGEYEGVPRILVWPSVELVRATADQVRDEVNQLLIDYRAAIAKAREE